mgnify:CR=1 FL=1
MNLAERTICFIGAGSMAEAIIRGIVSNRKMPPERLVAVNRRNQTRLAELSQNYGIRTAPQDKGEAVRQADILVLAMKPKDAEGALAEFRPHITAKQLVISVIAGLSIRSLSDMLPAGTAIVRTMPNTSSTIGLGATGISFSPGASDEHKRLAFDIFESIGIVREVEESLLDIITGVSGSGPAYVYYMIEALRDAGAEGGLDAETALDLAVQTVLGAAEMARRTRENPAELRRRVTSPGGTTQAALELMEREDWAGILKRAVRRAAERSRELGAMQDKR